MRYLVWPAKSLALVSLLSVAGFAQIHFTVQELNRTEQGFTYRVTNESPQPIRVFTVGIDITYADAQSFHSEQSIRIQKLIAPGASYEMAYVGDSRHGQIAKVELRPLVAIYADKSHEAVDSATYHRIADVETANTKAIEVTVNAIKQALANPSDAHPATAASATIEKAIADARTATASPWPGVRRIVVGQPVQPDEHRMQEALAQLQGITTRDELEKYLGKLQAELGGGQ